MLGLRKSLTNTITANSKRKRVNKLLLHKAGFEKNQNVLLYGDISKQLVFQTLKKLAPNGMVYIIGRNKQLVYFHKLNHGKFKNRVVVNPFFNDLPDNSLHHMLVANASLNLEVVRPLAIKARQILKPDGQLIVIDDKISRKELIALEDQIHWFRHDSESDLLIFKKK